VNLLLTGFEPFAGDARNPSGIVAAALDGVETGGGRVVAEVLPCVFGEAPAALLRAVARTSPEVVICLGLAGGRTGITVERVAINVDDARIPDNAGRQPVDRPVAAGGPVGYWSTLPIKAIVEDLREAGFPAAVSQTAGTFVCNHVFYALMHAVASGVVPTVRRAGFVHLPWLPEQANGGPCLTVERQCAAVLRLLRTAATAQERRSEGGRID
jgi:pyroglutamyl-peptidase